MTNTNAAALNARAAVNALLSNETARLRSAATEERAANQEASAMAAAERARAAVAAFLSR